MADVNVAQHVRRNRKTGKLEIVQAYVRQAGGQAALEKKGVDVAGLRKVAQKADKGLITDGEFRQKLQALKSSHPASASAPIPHNAKPKSKDGKPMLTGESKVENGKRKWKLTNGLWTDNPQQFDFYKFFYGKIKLSADVEQDLAEHADDDLELSLVDKAYVLSLTPGTLDRSPKHNWVEDAGGLPAYIESIAQALHRSGKSITTAIQIAISRCKVWAAGGGNVNADTRAKAAAAIAELKAKAAKSKASTIAKKALKSA